MSRFEKISGTDFARDVHSGGVVNINRDEISAARRAKQLRKNREQEFNDLKNEVGEIKELLNKLIEKL